MQCNEIEIVKKAGVNLANIAIHWSEIKTFFNRALIDKESCTSFIQTDFTWGSWRVSGNSSHTDAFCPGSRNKLVSLIRLEGIARRQYKRKSFRGRHCGCSCVAPNLRSTLRDKITADECVTNELNEKIPRLTHNGFETFPQDSLNRPSARVDRLQVDLVQAISAFSDGSQVFWVT